VNLPRFILIALLLSSLGSLVGCAPERKEKVKAVEREYYVDVIERNGHRYLMFNGVYHNVSGTVHDPDCPCHKK
jgi:hypothetical protein